MNDWNSYAFIILRTNFYGIFIEINMICDAVFEGGGVRGIGLAGALAAVEEAGYVFRRVAGTSVGAIIAALVAAGYNAAEIKKEIEKLDFKQFKDGGSRNAVETVYSLSKDFGIYKTTYFENWFSALLKRKNVRYFGDLKLPLKVTATDVTDNKLLIFPDDLKTLGLDPKTFPVLDAVRMSMGIPFFFKPYILTCSEGRQHYIVDGGMLSNNPVWLFYDNEVGCPLLNFVFTKNKNPKSSIKPKPKLFEYIKDLMACVIDDNSNYFNISDPDKIIISINTTVADKEIKSTYFDITKEETESLYNNGYKAGRDFLLSRTRG